MASILRVNTITDASSNNSIATSFVAGGSAKAWINIPSGQASINDSLNVSSLDDDGTGDGGINLTSSMANSNYTITTGENDSGSSTAIFGHDLTNGTQTTAGYDFNTFFVNAGSNRTDFDMQSFANIHGDLA